MIFTGSYWYYGIIQFGLVAVEVLLAVFWVGRNKTFDRIAMWLIAAYLLCYKFDEYGPFSAIPLDLSAMSYFFSAWRRSCRSVRSNAPPDSVPC